MESESEQSSTETNDTQDQNSDKTKPEQPWETRTKKKTQRKGRKPAPLPTNIRHMTPANSKPHSLTAHHNIHRSQLTPLTTGSLPNSQKQPKNQGTAIAIRKDIPFKLHDNFHSEMLGITVETPQGPITIGPTYIPPRTKYINYIDMHTLLRRQNPTYLLADMNAQHPTLEYNYTNKKGKQIHSLINKNKCIHIGPNFPTLLTHNSTTSPEIVLTNTQTFHNIRLQPGPLTPSDHIPIIATITANPIQIPICPRPSFHNADWTQYKSLLTAHTAPQDPLPTLEEIDNHLSNWESHITAAFNQAIPTITHRTIPGIKQTQETLLLQRRYHHICYHLRRHGHSPHLHRQLVYLRHQIKQTYKHIYSATWNHKITNMKINYNPKQF
ncbi:Endonuclease/exonuclease/phosphatase [Trinorchestia longiramus]|nr:Endonuclease/exonuclease/phosphatase [Trinorchestia longiramus]